MTDWFTKNNIRIVGRWFEPIDEEEYYPLTDVHAPLEVDTTENLMLVLESGRFNCTLRLGDVNIRKGFYYNVVNGNVAESHVEYQLWFGKSVISRQEIIVSGYVETTHSVIKGFLFSR